MGRNKEQELNRELKCLEPDLRISPLSQREETIEEMNLLYSFLCGKVVILNSCVVSFWYLTHLTMIFHYKEMFLTQDLT